MQYGSLNTEGAGTLVTTDGTAVIVGTDTLWVTSPLVAAGNLFTIEGINYEIGSVDTELQLTLTSAFAGPDASGQTYTISSSFTPNQNLPYPTKGDVETAALMKNALHKIDTIIADDADGVLGPASAVDNNIPLFDGTTGKLIKDGGKALPTTDIVGVDDTQTLTNKTITSPTISGGTAVLSSVQLSGGTGTQGTLTWNADEETLDLVNNDAVLQIGQEMYVHVRNNSGVTIPDGTPVMATGTVGASGRITIGLMDGTDPTYAKYYIGITTESIINGDDGKVTTMGKVRGLDTTGTPYTETWVEGNVIWISTTTAGNLTNIEPTSGLGLAIAFVITGHATSGVLMSRATSMDDNAYTPIAHITDTVDAHDASAISNVPAGDIVATEVQAAIDELDTDKVPRTSTTGSAKLPSGTTAQRDGTPVTGAFRFNSDTSKTEVYSGATWDTYRSGGDLGAATLTHNFTSDADYILTTTENLYGRIVLTDTSVFLTVARNVVVSNTQRVIYVQNDTAQALTVKTTAGTGVSIAAGDSVMLVNDSTNIIDPASPNLLYGYEVVGAAQTFIDIDGLDINTHKSYRIEMELLNNTATGASISLFINDDNVATNYYSQYLSANGATRDSDRFNAADISYLDASNIVACDFLLQRNIDGHCTTKANNARGGATNLSLYQLAWDKTAAESNITKIRLSASVANAIKIGSKLRIYRGDK